MSQKFEVDFQDALRNLADFNRLMQGAGTSLDNLEGKTRSSSKGIRDLLDSISKYYGGLDDKLKHVAKGAEEAAGAIKSAQSIAEATLASMATANLKATTQAHALAGGLKGVDTLMKNTASKESYVRWTLKAATVTDEIANRNQYLKAALIATHTQESKNAQQRLTKIAGYNKLYTTETRQMLLTKQLKKDLELQGTAAGRTNSVLQARIGVLKAQQQEETLLNGKLEAAKRAYQGELGAARVSLDVQQLRNKAISEAATAETKQTLATQSLTQQLKLQGTEAGATNERLKARISALAQAQTADIKSQATLDNLKRTHEGLRGGIQAEIEVQKVRNKAQTEAVTADVRQAAAMEKLTRDMQQQVSTLGQTMAAMQARLGVVKRAQQEDEKAVGKLGELRRAYESLDGGIQGQIVKQAEVNRGRAQAITAEERERNTVAELRRQIESLNGGLAEQAVHLRHQKSVREQEILGEVRQKQTLADLENTLRSLNGGTQEQIVRVQELIRQRKSQITEDMRAASSTKELTKAEKDAARAAEAEAKAQKELDRQKQHALDLLARLKAQMTTLTGAHAREIQELEKAIAKQKEYNRLLTLSTAELLGFTSAQARAARSLNMSNQSGAMLRATLAGLQTSIGMYTSSTILAAASTYGLARAIRSSIETGTEFGYTMSRVQAIMGAGFGPQIEAGMANAEQVVRALGQSTRYTATEVAGGLQELGMAGLSASQAMVALEPSLNMALIGNISMAESADIATNVMMQFGLQARDLTHVVDIMATAMTSSNTTVTQLANALSYIGPAAESAGFSLEDTTAAIEVLANNGIKASRAGTGLRRMFVNMLNPTAKGAAMLAEYGISIDDAEGNTRSFSDILGQLHDALYNDVITPGERTAAVVDLVGVRAASAVTALIASMGKDGGFEAMRMGLDDVAGAASRMREAMEDNLSTDWKSLLSAFQEAQLTLFDGQEDRMRLLTKEMTSYLTDLAKPLEGSDLVSLGFDASEIVTQIDLIVARIENMVTTLTWAGGAYLSFKLLASNNLLATSARWSDLATKYKLVEVRSRENMVAMSQLQRSFAVTGMQVGMYARTVGGLNSALAGTSGYAASAAVGMSRLAAAAAPFMAALGWAGVLAGLGTALYSFFNNNAADTLKEQREEVDNLKNSYKDLKDTIDQLAEIRQRRALEDQVGAYGRGIEDIQAEVARMEETKRFLEANGVNTDLIVRQLTNLATQRAAMERAQQDAAESLSRLGTNENDIRAKAEQVEDVTNRLKELQSQLLQAQNTSGPNIGGGIDTPRVQKLKEKIAELNVELDRLVEESANVQEALISGAEAFAMQLREINGYIGGIERVNGLWAKTAELGWQPGSLDQAGFDKFATAQEKVAAASERLAAAQAELNRVQEAQSRIDAGAGTTEDSRLVGATNTKRILEELEEAELKHQEAMWELTDERQKTSAADLAARQELAESQMDEQVLVELLRSRYADLNGELAIRQAISAGGSEYAAEGLREEHEIIEELMAVRDRLNSTLKEGEKSTRSASAAERELQRSISEATRTYEALLKASDPVAASIKDMADKTKQLDLLLKENEISADQYAVALRQLKKEHVELTIAQDKNRESLENLRDTYLSSEFSSEAEDLSELNRLYREGAIEMAEYARIKGEMMERSRESALNGAPTVNYRNQNGSGTLGNEFVGAMVERSEGLKWYQDRGDALFDGYENQTTGIYNEADQKAADLQAQLEAEAITREAHAERLMQIEQEKNAALLAAQEAYGEQSKALDDSRAEYTESSSKVATLAAMQSAQSFLGMFASASEEATALQKAAFIAQKALSVASIIMYTEVAAIRAGAELGPFGLPLAAMIRATGYASAGMVAAMAIGDLATGGKASASGNYSGAYDDGGWIPHNKWGIVGEYGPEIVQGPAQVTSRRRTANKLEEKAEEA